MPQFSLVLIARNEAQTLPKLFRSLHAFVARVGEIVIVDTGSTDNTAELARAFGCRVFEMGDAFTTLLSDAQANEINARFSKNGETLPVTAGQRLFHFANARNFASTCARNEFVFHLDAADELRAFDDAWLDAQLETGMVSRFEYWRIAALPDPRAETISFRIANFFDRRLFQWEGFAHEAVCPIPNPPHSSQQTLICSREQLLLRHVKDPTKTRHYLAPLALELLAHPGNTRWLHYLGRELYYLGQHHSAIALLEENAATESGWRAERCESLCLVGRCYEILGETRQAEEAYLRAAQLDSTRREPLLRYALLRQQQGDLAGSVEYARAALALLRTNSYIESDSNYTFLPHAILYWGLYWLGDKKQARQHWEYCLAMSPENRRYREHAKLFE